MKYLFSSLTGSVVLDTALRVLDSVPFSSLDEYQQRAPAEKKLFQKYPDLKPLPVEKASGVLAHFRDEKYRTRLREQNRELTAFQLSHSVGEDQLVIQAVAAIGELDRTANMLSKRLREWYELYCPEASHAIADHARFIEAILSKDKEHLLKELHRSRSFGAELGEEHVQEMLALAQQVRHLYTLRMQYEQYLQRVMQKYCPNLLELAGGTLGAKLLALGKGLKHLALLPASTIQLLGAEKALFRHLKTNARAPKYGILYQHQLVQKAKPKERGKMARMLADKLSLCARLDYFKGEFKAKEYGKELEGKIK